MSQLNRQEYVSFAREIKVRIRERQLRALRSINRELVSLYWDIGELIDRKQMALG